MSDQSTTPRRPDAPQRDEGVTLIELLLAVLLTGILMSAVSSAMVVLLRSERPTLQRVSISKDVTFLQTWIPADLSSSVSSYTDPTFWPTTTMALPGTNAVTIRRPDVTPGNEPYYYVAYIYEKRGDEWMLIRYEIRNVGRADETVATAGVAHELAAPPADWLPTQRPAHAIDFTTRNQVTLRPIGEDISVTFVNGESFKTGGARLSAEEIYDESAQVLPDPTAPPSRCRGRVALILDTSLSVQQASGGAVGLKAAANGFVDALTGTPVQMSIIGFDRKGYQIWPSSIAYPSSNVLDTDSADLLAQTRTEFGQYFSLLDTTDTTTANNVAQAHTRINNIYWNYTGGIVDSRRGGTNWEDALRRSMRNLDPSPYTNWNLVSGRRIPDWVVFVTDGQPNFTEAQRDNSGSEPSPASTQSVDVTKATEAAAYAKAYGAKVVGVLVGADAGDAVAVDNLADVVGDTRYVSTATNQPNTTTDPAHADYFIETNFAQLSNILKQIMTSRCGGTVTVQKKIWNAGTGAYDAAPGTWTYSTETGSAEISGAGASMTFDFSIDGASRWVNITEAQRDGYAFDYTHTVCSVAGTPLVKGTTMQNYTDGTGATVGVSVLLQPDQAVSCVMASVPA